MKTPFDALIAEAAEASDLDKVLVQALIAQESGGNPWASRVEPGYLANEVVKREAQAWSQRHHGVPTTQTELYLRSSSFGLLQIMGQVARENGFAPRYLTALYDPMTNLELGCRLLQRRKIKAASLEHLILMWNAGIGSKPPVPDNAYVASVKKFMEETPYGIA